MGLDSFSTDDDDTVDEVDDEPTGLPWIDDFPSTEWNNMSTDEKVEYVRDNYMEDYRPDHTPNDGWDWSSAVAVSCVCDYHFYFVSVGACPECGQYYKQVGRTVRLLKDKVKANGH